MTERDLDRIFKAYDVRGVVPDDLDDDLVRAIGGAYARITDDRPILIGRDCRLLVHDGLFQELFHSFPIAAIPLDSCQVVQRRGHVSVAGRDGRVLPE